MHQIKHVLNWRKDIIKKKDKNWQIQIKQEKLNTTEFHKLTREQKNTELKYVSCLWKTKKNIKISYQFLFAKNIWKIFFYRIKMSKRWPTD